MRAKPGFGVENRLMRYGRGSRKGSTPPSSSATSLPVAGAIDRPSMLWPAAIITFSHGGAAVDDRQAVVGHRPPAEPLLDRLAVGLAQIGGRAVLQELEPLGSDRLVVAGEFHGRAQPVARLERRDGHAGLGKDQRDLGADRGPRHGQAVALARLDRHAAAELVDSAAASRRRWRRRKRRRLAPSCR